MKRPEVFNDSYQNWKKYLNKKAQLVIADPPYALGVNMYASSPLWYNNGSNENGESDKAAKAAFDSDFNFHPAEFMHFCSDLLVKEPKEQGKAPCMVLFCNWEHQFQFVELGKRYGFNHYIPLVFRKNYSPQVLKANMKVVGNCEYGLILYKEKLPKFNNNGQMVFNCMDWGRDNSVPKIHPTQKSYPLIKRLIELFTDPGDVVIDPCCGSGVALRAAYELGREAYGFEIKKEFVKAFNEKMMANVHADMFASAELAAMEAERKARIEKYAKQSKLEI